MKKFFTLSVLLGLSSSMPAFAEGGSRMSESFADDSPYQMQLFTGIYKQNSSDGNAKASALLPLLQSQDVLFFAQIGRTQDFNVASVTSSNIGLRWLTNEQSMLWGVYAGYDYQKTNYSNVFHNFALGAEWRSERWHIYGNAYLPISNQQKTIIHDNSTVTLSTETDSNGYYNVDVERIYSTLHEESLSGVDANIGYTFWQAINAQVYLGAYSYTANQVPSVKGTRAQLQFDLFNAYKNNQPNYFLNRITVESSLQYDNVNKTSWYAGLKFVFDLAPSRAIGRVTPLTRMQQYMQYEIPRDAGTVIDSHQHTTTTNGQLLNAAGNPFSIAKVSNESAFDNAINNRADLIAVQGHIENMATKVLNNDQVLTGGDHVFDNGATLTLGNNGQLTASAGRDLIRVGQNNRIENIILNADPDQFVISNNLTIGNSVKTLTVNNIIANAGIRVYVIDGSTDSVLNITNNRFNMGNVDNQRAIYHRVQSGSSQINVSDNTIVFGDGDSNLGIYLYSFSTTGAGSAIHSSNITNNVFTFGSGNSNSAMRFFSTDNEGFLATMSLDNLRDNTISFDTGDNNSGLYLIVSSLSERGQITVNNIINNTFTFAAGNSLTGLNAEIGGMIGSSRLSLNTVYGNSFNMPVAPEPASTNYGFKLLAGSPASLFTDINAAVATDMITINVNHNQQSLSEANNNALINPSSTWGNGEVIITTT